MQVQTECSRTKELGGDRKRYIFARQYRKRLPRFCCAVIVGNYYFLYQKKLPRPVLIKRKESKLFPLFFMAAPQPTNLEEYCKVHNVSLFDLSLPCVFCKFDIDYLGLAEFHYKKLCLIYKSGISYACCGPCLRLTAKYEAQQYCRCAIDPTCVEFLYKKPLCDITVRCLCCFKALDLIEKYDCIVADLPFYLIRHHLRNYCRHCVKTI